MFTSLHPTTGLCSNRCFRNSKIVFLFCKNILKWTPYFGKLNRECRVQILRVKALDITFQLPVWNLYSGLTHPLNHFRTGRKFAFFNQLKNLKVSFNFGLIGHINGFQCFQNPLSLFYPLDKVERGFCRSITANQHIALRWLVDFPVLNGGTVCFGGSIATDRDKVLSFAKWGWLFLR